MSSVLRRRGDKERRNTKDYGYVKTEAETEIMLPQAK